MARYRSSHQTPTHVQDGWSNSLKGLGTTAALAGTSFRAGSIANQRSYLELCDNDWLARRICGLVIGDALRARPNDIDATVWAQYDTLALDTHLARGLLQGRAAGGAAILLGYTRGTPTEPAPAPGAAELAWVDTVPWDMLSVETKETDANLPRYQLPAIVRVNGDHARHGLRIHMSRVIQCEGLERAAPRLSDQTPWISVLQPCYEDLAQYGLTWASVSLLLQEASTGVLKMKGLIRMLGQKDQAAVQTRMQLMNEGRSSAHTVFLDADGEEEYSRVDVTFNAVPQMLEQWTTRAAALAGIPVTRLFGRSPSGLQATGDSDVRQWYDDVEYYRRQSVEPKQRRLLSILAGTELPSLTYPPLWQPTSEDSAKTRKLNAEADKIWYDLDVIDPPELRTARSADGSLGVAVSETRTPVA